MSYETSWNGVEFMEFRDDDRHLHMADFIALSRDPGHSSPASVVVVRGNDGQYRLNLRNLMNADSQGWLFMDRAWGTYDLADAKRISQALAAACAWAEAQK